MFNIKITKLLADRYNNHIIRIYGVHFRANGVDYFLHHLVEAGECYAALYKGRNKCHLKQISGCYLGCGNYYLDDFIKFKKNTTCLSHIDTNYFIEELQKKGLWKGELELL